MGDRAQVRLYDDKTEGSVYLYTHWNGSDLRETVKAALSRRQRWDDVEYLARIVFEEMIQGNEGSESGFGIGYSEHFDLQHSVIELDCSRQVMVVDNVQQTFEQFITK